MRDLSVSLQTVRKGQGFANLRRREAFTSQLQLSAFLKPQNVPSPESSDMLWSCRHETRGEQSRVEYSKLHHLRVTNCRHASTGTKDLLCEKPPILLTHGHPVLLRGCFLTCMSVYAYTET